MGLKKKIGLFLVIVAGVIALLNLKITGAVIGFEKSSYWSLISVGLFFIGAYFLATPVVEGGLQGVIWTDEFRRDVRKFKPSREVLERVERKVLRGSGDQHYNKRKGGWSVDADKGSRAYFEIKGGRAYLLNYVPSSKHA